MKIHYAGKYSGNPDDLPYIEHEPGAVPFKEPQGTLALGIIANSIAVIVIIALYAFMFYLNGPSAISFAGTILALATMFPHEFLHAICFKEDAYVYTNFKHGMLFVVGPERMSKSRFLFLGMLPNVVFGFIPFALYLINPNWNLLGTMGALCIAMGAGDYINVFNALTQMPKGSKCYMHKLNSFWYMPKR